MDEDTRRKRSALTTKLDFGNKSGKKRGCIGQLLRGTFDDHDSDSIILNRSSHSLKGAYLGFRDKSDKDPTELCNGSNSDSEGKRDQETVDTSAMLDMIQQSSKEDRILQAMIAERNKTSELRRIFHKMDSDGNGTIDLDEFIDAYKRVNPDLSVEDITTLFLEGKDIY
jgi:Ca2+-binding EF-hand superfamily protein